MSKQIQIEFNDIPIQTDKAPEETDYLAIMAIVVRELL
jgi:hypothetical protein